MISRENGEVIAFAYGSVELGLGVHPIVLHLAVGLKACGRSPHETFVQRGSQRIDYMPMLSRGLYVHSIVQSGSDI